MIFVSVQIKKQTYRDVNESVPDSQSQTPRCSSEETVQSILHDYAPVRIHGTTGEYVQGTCGNEHGASGGGGHPGNAPSYG